jgi:hypothetical protein
MFEERVDSRVGFILEIFKPSVYFLKKGLSGKFKILSSKSGDVFKSIRGLR